MKRLALAALFAVACSSEPKGPGPVVATNDAAAWRKGVMPPELADFVVAIGEGPTEDAARADATRTLERKIWGEVPVPAGTTVPRSDLVEKTDAADTHAVLLAVDKSVLARLMQARIETIGYTADDPNAPYGARLANAIANMTRGREKQQACSWVKSCTTDEGGAMREALLARLDDLELTTSPNGVPFRRGVGPLKPAMVTARLRSKPTASAYGITLRALDGNQPLGGPVSTASDGSARFDLSGCGSAQARIVLEAPELTDVALPEVAVALREITSANARVAVHLEVTADDNRVASDPAVKATIEAIASVGMARPEALPPRLATVLASPRQTDLALRDIAELADGSIDVIVAGTVQTAFANRMGARSVWHEAKAKVAVYDVWTGTLIAEHSREAQAVGLGDGAAQAKAIAEVAKLLAADIKNDVTGLSAGGAVANSGLR